MRATVAWVLAGLTAVLCVADVVVTAQYRPLLSEAAVAQHGFPFVDGAVLGSAVLGAIIIGRYERHAIGWLLSIVGATGAFSLVTEAYSIWVITEGGPGSRELAGVSGWLSSLVSGQFAIGGLSYMFILAPDGRFMSRRWRYAALVPALGVLTCTAGLATLNPTTFDIATRSGDQGLGGLLFSIGFLLICAGLVVSVASMGVRLRRSQGEQRQQVRLIAMSAALVSCGVAALFVVQLSNGGEQTWASALPLFVSYFLLPILFAVAVLRYRLYDIEVIVNRTVVLAVAAAFAGLGYTVLVVVVGNLVGQRTSGFWLSLLATALVALAFQPLRRQVVLFANRLAYGSRAQPYEALSEFSRRIAQTPTPQMLLPAVADAAGRAVAARRTRTTLEVPGANPVTADWGQDGGDAGDTHVVPVQNGGVALGSIEVTLPKGRALRPADLRLLAALADQTAVAFRNTALETQLEAHVAELDRTTHELAESRSRIVEADDAARRTLEAAISREVLPYLVPLPEALDQARVAVAEGDGGDGIERLVASTNTALESLRELTRGVFPTQLARAGVEPALRSFLARSGLASTLHVDPSAAGRRFSDRVEAAVYFGATEVARAAPGLSSIELSVVGEDLLLRVSGGASAALHLEAIVDRVEAAGGSLSPADEVLELRLPVATDESAYASLGSGGPGL